MVKAFRYETDEPYDTIHLVRQYDPDTNELTTECGITFQNVFGARELGEYPTPIPEEARCGRCQTPRNDR